MTLIWFIYAAWLLLIVYLTVQAIGVKRDTEPHLLQSFGLMFAMIAAFLLPRLPLFGFVNFAPRQRGPGRHRRGDRRRRHGAAGLGAANSRPQLEPDRLGQAEP
ncbi:hypothetical protein [Mesorhizobium sp. B2-8-3]|uniref:hypothetical protein n=1 Tax=Mesorhizobium sp. B2-8-3 TaxID=2589905 RepID=UPI00112C103E|nr:hypothetical protein [Mesorhizobium sp. B2-8-3]TPJ28200.1 hypothetical protein FJ418_27200 [Mesorhizobium sp. B2-8-3]